MTTLKEFRTKQDLLETLKQAARRGVSPAELKRQRVDYIVGAMSDEKTKITSDMVTRELERMAGAAN